MKRIILYLSFMLSGVPVYATENVAYSTGGGIAGNEKLGVVCLTPSLGSMTQCNQYNGMSGDFILPNEFPRSEAIFSIEDGRINIFDDFDGYPHIIENSEGNCSLSNKFLSTYDFVDDSIISYACDETGEYFSQEDTDEAYWNLFNFSDVNQAHFYAGLTLQMYYRYFGELNNFSNSHTFSGPFCPQNGPFCIKHLRQKINSPVVGAEWDRDSVNYGLGDFQRFSFTTLDIVAHEITHAIGDWNGFLRNGGFSSVIDEAIADIGAAAVYDFFLKNVKGSYRDSVVYSMKTSLFKWWFAWDSTYFDMFLSDRGLRYFDWPSRDGNSINDVRGNENKRTSTYYSGGVIRKFYHGLIEEDGWSHESAFKLLLKSYTACLSLVQDYKGFGGCVYSQVSETFSSSNEISSLLENVDRQFKSVGIIDIDNAFYTPIGVDLNMLNNVVAYSISEDLNLNDVDGITVEWGDGEELVFSSENSLGIESLNGIHRYISPPGISQFSIRVFFKNGTVGGYFKNINVESNDEVCQPKIKGDSYAGESINLGEVEYPLDGHKNGNINVLYLSETGSLIDFNDSSSRRLSFYVDKNKDNRVSNEELINLAAREDGSYYINDALEGLDTPSYVRVLLSSEENIDVCGEFEGAYKDFIIQSTVSASSPIDDMPKGFDFDYEQIENSKAVRFFIRSADNADGAEQILP